MFYEEMKQRARRQDLTATTAPTTAKNRKLIKYTKKIEAE